MTNKGTGAGGSRTNLNGKRFENDTTIKEILRNQNYTFININNNCFFYKKVLDDKTIIFLYQTNFKN